MLTKFIICIAILTIASSIENIHGTAAKAASALSSRSSRSLRSALSSNDATSTETKGNSSILFLALAAVQAKTADDISIAVAEEDTGNF